jgi:hypothetical protein
MPPKKGGKKKVEEVDPAVAAAEAKRKAMIKEADALKKQIDFEVEEEVRMKASKGRAQLNWVRRASFWPGG